MDLTDRLGAIMNALWVIARFLSERRRQICQDELSLLTIKEKCDARR